MARKAGKAGAGRSSGRWVTTLEGYRAFHPHPLPPPLEWTPTLVAALADASMLVGRLAGEGRRLPNPHVLIRPFIRREAVLSSRIEGTQATLGELLAAEAGVAVERLTGDADGAEADTLAREAVRRSLVEVLRDGDRPVLAARLDRALLGLEDPGRLRAAS